VRPPSQFEDRLFLEPPIGAGIGSMPIKALLAQIWTFCAPMNRWVQGSITSQQRPARPHARPLAEGHRPMAQRIEASFGEITEQMGLTRHALIPSAGCSPEPQRPSPPTP
jgi:hypothetical protein